MGRALTRDAGTFLFDEPLSNLDAKLRGQMRAELALMSQRVRKNMIYVTHDQIEAMTLADRIVVMHGGHIQQQGSPEDLFKRPVNKFVAGFLGTPPMNFLDATLQARGSELYAVGDGFELQLTEQRRAALQGGDQRDVILGIRPSDLRFNADATANRSLELNVLVAEYVGAQSVLLCQCADTTITVEVNSETPMALKQTLSFEVNPERIHFFDRESEAAL
jgi:multiple sugar transport system ATP-binding protein